MKFQLYSNYGEAVIGYIESLLLLEVIKHKDNSYEGTLHLVTVNENCFKVLLLEDDAA